MEITGQVVAILAPTQGVSQRTGNSWVSQNYVIQTQEQYPKKICFKVFGSDRIAAFNIQNGEVITVCFDINANEYQGKWYNDVSCFSIKRNGVAVQLPQHGEATPRQGFQQPADYATQPQTPQQPTLFPPTVNAQGWAVPEQGNQQPFIPSTYGQNPPF